MLVLVTTRPIEDMISATEAGAILGVDRRTVSRWIEAGTLTASTLPGRWLVSRRQVEELKARRDAEAVAS